MTFRALSIDILHRLSADVLAAVDAEFRLLKAVSVGSPRRL